MKSAEKPPSSKTVLNKLTKKLVVPPKSAKQSSESISPKKGSSLMKKFKLKSKSAEVATKNVSLSLPSTSSALRRQTPEGDESLLLIRSVSERNLSEHLKSTEIFPSSSSSSLVVDNKDTGKVVNVKEEIREIDGEVAAAVSVEPESDQRNLGRLKNMPAYGDLIIDSAIMVNSLFRNLSSM